MVITEKTRAGQFDVARKTLAEGLSTYPSRLIVMVGAGVSVATANAPDWTALVRNLCDFAALQLPADWIGNMREMIHDRDNIIEAATLLRTNLPPGVFGYFLADQFKNLASSIDDGTLYAIIDKLRLAGARIVTTNYDTLIEEELALGRMNWTSDGIQTFFQARDAKQNSSVLHIHGLYDRPKDLVFTSAEYSRITDTSEKDVTVVRLQQFLRDAFTNSCILFIGCGDTTSDPHIGHLFNFGVRMGAGETLRHVHLCTDEVYKRLGRTVNRVPSSVYLLPYGDYPDLGPAIKRLFPNVFKSDGDPKAGLVKDIQKVMAQTDLNADFNKISLSPGLPTDTAQPDDPSNKGPSIEQRTIPQLPTNTAPHGGLPTKGSSIERGGHASPNNISTLSELYNQHVLRQPVWRTPKFPHDDLLNKRVSIWRGDITALKVWYWDCSQGCATITIRTADMIVNAAHESLLGGDVGTVDGAIHKAAGPGLLDECRKLGWTKTGDTKVTKGYNLPAKFIAHTVGPVYSLARATVSEELLASCYRTSLEQCALYGGRTIGLPSISTGNNRFPYVSATQIGFETVRTFLEKYPSITRVIFVVFSDKDEETYLDVAPDYFPGPPASSGDTAGKGSRGSMVSTPQDPGRVSP